jgi:hypothetical protein
MNDWRKFWQLAPWERLMFLQAATLISLVSLGLHALGWQRLMRFLERLSPGRDQYQLTKQTHDYTFRAAYVVNAAAGRRVLHATCLQRSIVLWWLLRRDGIETQIKLGARKEQCRFQAHAWVEYEGEVINDRPEIREEYAIFEQT